MLTTLKRCIARAPIDHRFFFMSIQRCTLRAFLCVRVRVPKGLPTAQFDFSKDFQLVSGEVRTRMACHFGGLGFANDRQAIRIIF